MAKLYTGTYGSGTTPENALNTALLQYPEIARTLIQQYPRYSATYLMERTGRFASEKVLGDNSFEWKVMGRYNAPTFSAGWISTDGVTFVGSTGDTGASSENWKERWKREIVKGKKFYIVGSGNDGDYTDELLIEIDDNTIAIITSRTKIFIHVCVFEKSIF